MRGLPCELSPNLSSAPHLDRQLYFEQFHTEMSWCLSLCGRPCKRFSPVAKKPLSYPCSSIGGMLAYCAQSPQFDPKHPINLGLGCMPVIQDSGGYSRSIRISRSSSATRGKKTKTISVPIRNKFGGSQREAVVMCLGKAHLLRTKKCCYSQKPESKALGLQVVAGSVPHWLGSDFTVFTIG